MGCYIVDRMGGGEDGDDNPTAERMWYHLASLDPHDIEHGSVTLVHRETGWHIAYFGGLLVLENTDLLDSESHLKNVTPEKALELWALLAVGDLDAIRTLPWKKGYG